MSFPRLKKKSEIKFARFLADKRNGRSHNVCVGDFPRYDEYGEQEVASIVAQGQRTLSPLYAKDLQQEVVTPAGDLAFAFDAAF